MIQELYTKGYLLAVRLAQDDIPGDPNTGGTSGDPKTGTVPIPGNLPGADGSVDLAGVIGNVINWGLSMAGGVAVLMLIAGGFIYITAAGDEKRIDRGKAIVRSAITGIIIILISAIIVNTIRFAILGN